MSEAVRCRASTGAARRHVASPRSPAFEIWLVTERRHLAGAAEAVLREAALARLASGDASAPPPISPPASSSPNPLDEGHQVAPRPQPRRRGRRDRRIAGRRPAAPSCSGASSGSSRARRWPPRPRPVTAAPTAGPVEGPRSRPRAARGRGRRDRRGRASTRACSACAAPSSTRRGAGDPELRGGRARGARVGARPRGRADATRRPRPRCTRRSRSRHAPRARLTSAAAAARASSATSSSCAARYERAEAWFERAGLRRAILDPAERGRIGSVLGSVRSDTAHYARAADTLAEALRPERRRRVTGVSLAYSLVDARPRAPPARRAGRRRGDARRLARPRCGARTGPRSRRGPRRCAGDVDLARGDLEAALPSATSTPSRWDASSATRAGRGSARGESGSCRGPQRPRSRRRVECAPRRPAALPSGCPTPTCGSRPTRSTRSARSASRTTCRRPRAGWMT